MKFTATQLKLGMAFLMLLDHIHQFIPGVPMFFTYLGRIVAPVFYFLLVESYHYTKDRLKLITRLYLFALIMGLGNLVLVTYIPTDMGIPNNILLNMAIGLSLLEAGRRLNETKKIKTKLALGLLLLALFLAIGLSEGTYLALGMLVLFFFYRENATRRDIAFLLLSFTMLGFDFSYQAIWLIRYQWMMVLAIPFFHLYDGTRGRPLKWFFYIFYPLHIWFLYLLRFVLLR